MTTLKVKQIRSAIGSKPKHRGSLRALGLKKIGSEKEVQDSPQIRGVIHTVRHLVEVTEL